jgi:catechol 2,3-dioxygenase-like lactoylglutathione lyase family enzyme
MAVVFSASFVAAEEASTFQRCENSFGGFLMLSTARPVAFVATADAARARSFYESVLGLRVVADQPFALVLDSAGTTIRVQKVDAVRAAPYTALGWEVPDVDAAVRSLADRGVAFERYAGMKQDKLGIWTSPSGARVAWFRDPDGNILSLTGG